MSEKRLEVHELLPHQRYIVENRGRFNVVCGGRRGGKTGLIEYLLYGSDFGVLSGLPVSVFGISRSTMTNIWEDALRVGYNIISDEDNVARSII